MMARSQAVENFDLSWIHKEMRCWVYLPNNGEADIFDRGVVKNIVPLSLNKGNSSIMGLLDNGTEFKTKASLLEKIRESNSMERDLIEMDTINGPEVLLMLKRRLLDRKIHTCLWDSLIIVNPFRLIPEQYSEKMLLHYFEHIFLRKEDLRKYLRMHAGMSHTYIPSPSKCSMELGRVRRRRSSASAASQARAKLRRTNRR